MFELLLYASALAAPSGASAFESTPVDPEPVAASELIMDAGEAVRAVTWDTLDNPPSEPQQIRMACLVVPTIGVPGSCVPASLLTPGQTTTDWLELAEQAEEAARLAPPEQFALQAVAQGRIATMRLKRRPSAGAIFEIRVFEITVSPEDSRPPFVAGEAMLLGDVGLARQIDGTLLGTLYPPFALRYELTSKVTITCRIKKDRSLLCRDPGVVQLDQDIPARLPSPLDDLTLFLKRDFLFATYQAASTVEVNAKDKYGRDVIGRDVIFALTWQLPATNGGQKADE